MNGFSITNIAFSISLLTVLALHSASGATLTLTKEQAVQMALGQNKSLAAARMTIEQAQARKELAGKLKDPEISFDYYTDEMFNNEGESNFTIGFQQKFPVTKRIGILKDIADIEISLAKAEIRNQERLLIKEVELVYYDLAHIGEELELLSSLEALNKEFSSFIESRIQSAEASIIDANQVRIELFVIEKEIQQLKNKRKEFSLKLKRLLGAPLDTVLEIGHQHHAFETPPTGGSEDLEDHPEYQFKRLLLEIARKQSQLTLAKRWDDIAVGVFFKDERSVDEPLGIGNDRMLGMSLSIPLPVRKRTSAAVKIATAKEIQIEKELEAISLDLRVVAESLGQKVANLYEQARRYDSSVTQLVEQNMEDMNAAYSSGQISLNDLFRSQEQRLKLQSAHLAIMHDYLQALVEWNAATARNLSNHPITQ